MAAIPDHLNSSLNMISKWIDVRLTQPSNGKFCKMILIMIFFLLGMSHMPGKRQLQEKKALFQVVYSTG